MVRTCKIQKETGIQKETAGFMEGIPVSHLFLIFLLGVTVGPSVKNLIF